MTTDGRNMTNISVRMAIRGLEIIAFLLLTAGFGVASDAKLDLSNKTIAVITGGDGAKRWTLRYGSVNGSKPYAETPSLINVAGGRAWFANGGWLRLIDTNEGRVLGRWHVSESIVRMTPMAVAVEIESV